MLLVCFFSNEIYIFVSISELSFGSIQLYQRGISLPSYSHGIIQIYMDNQWGNICKDSKFRQKEADVVCHQLSYTGASTYSSAGVMRYRQTTIIDIHMIIIMPLIF